MPARGDESTCGVGGGTGGACNQRFNISDGNALLTIALPGGGPLYAQPVLAFNANAKYSGSEDFPDGWSHDFGQRIDQVINCHAELYCCDGSICRFGCEHPDTGFPREYDKAFRPAPTRSSTS